MNGNTKDWDINDSQFSKVQNWDSWDDWPDGHCRYVYEQNCEEAKKHTSGWAMRNTNNHNVNILKKSCLGVLVCSKRCIQKNGKPVAIRPAICDKARKKQQGKLCPNSLCDGILEIQPCRGHCGYPVTHFWRHVPDFGILFQAKGYHDHCRPASKSITQLKVKNTNFKRGDLLPGSSKSKRAAKSDEKDPPKSEEPLFENHFELDKYNFDDRSKIADFPQEIPPYVWTGDMNMGQRKSYEAYYPSPCEPAHSTASSESNGFEGSVPPSWDPTTRLQYDSVPKQAQGNPQYFMHHQQWTHNDKLTQNFTEDESFYYVPSFDLTNPSDIFQLEKSIEYDYSIPYDYNNTTECHSASYNGYENFPNDAGYYCNMY